jgi:phosphoesterase RecJ-like protein
VNAPASAPAWSTNTTPAELAAWLLGAPRVLAITHAKPDGDAIGSTMSVVRALRLRGVDAHALYAGILPHWTERAAGASGPESWLTIEKRGLPELGANERVVVLDTGSRSQLEPYLPLLERDAMPARTAIVDHHQSGAPELGERRIIEPRIAAACALACDLCVRILGLGSARELPTEIAEPLYLGLATDTGWFRHANVTPDVMRLAADLMSTGIRHAELFQDIEQTDSEGRMRLLARALATLVFLRDGQIAIMSLRMDDFRESKAHAGETGGFLDLVKSVESVRVAALLTEVEENHAKVVKISLRSKSGNKFVDVNEIAKRFGGGGHTQAAGARVQGSLEDVRAKLIGALT